MTLSCMFYNVNDEHFDKIISVFRSVFGSGQGNFRVDARFSDAEQAAKFLTQTRSTRLLVTYVSSHRNEDGHAMPDMDAVRLGYIATRSNRDNYVLYLAQDNETLLRMASSCVRAVATMTLPMFVRRGQAALGMIREDYRQLTAAEDTSEGEWIHLKVIGGTVVRLHTSRLYAVLSENKELEVHTADGVMKAYGSLDGMHKQLGDGFCRCHRSCLINRDAIQYVDFAGMTIALMDGTLVPLAKSFRQAMSQLVSPGARQDMRQTE